jgi:hypothetical protein
MLKQGLEESVEEGTTSVLGNWADRLIMGENSEYERRVRQYMANGMTEEEAKAKVRTDNYEGYIYDALSGGRHRDRGTVMYGHGSSYYRNTKQRAHEILANWGTLSVAHPELVAILAEDKPELVEALREVIKEMLKGVK